MKHRIKQPLRLWVEVECDDRGRNDGTSSKRKLLSRILFEWEASGFAMRYIGSGGRICWKATPKFLERLREAELDALEDTGDE